MCCISIVEQSISVFSSAQSPFVCCSETDMLSGQRPPRWLGGHKPPQWTGTAETGDKWTASEQAQHFSHRLRRPPHAELNLTFANGRSGTAFTWPGLLLQVCLKIWCMCWTSWALWPCANTETAKKVSWVRPGFKSQLCPLLWDSSTNHLTCSHTCERTQGGQLYDIDKTRWSRVSDL